MRESELKQLREFLHKIQQPKMKELFRLSKEKKKLVFDSLIEQLKGLIE